MSARIDRTSTGNWQKFFLAFASASRRTTNVDSDADDTAAVLPLDGLTKGPSFRRVITMLTVTLPAVWRAPTEEALRCQAVEVLFAAGDRLIDALRQSAGEDGVALGYACRDIVCDRDVTPVSWPIDDVVALLFAAEPEFGQDARRLRERLVELSARIDHWAEQADGGAEALRAA